MSSERLGKRLSTAAQFFLDEENAIEDNKSTQEKVVELLNSAAVMTVEAEKVSALKKVQEIVINQDKNLLDNFLDEMLAFQHDKGIEVKKTVIGFIESACKVDNEILPKVMANLRMMLCDEAVAVQKRLIQAATQVYKVILKWLFAAKNITSIMESTWVYMEQIKSEIIGMLDSDNDGIRTNAIKFMEALVLIQTHSDTKQDGKNKNTTIDVSINDIPAGFTLFTEEELKTAAFQIFDSLIVFHGSPHISSVNLMACMGSLCLIAKQRPELFLSKVVQALEALHVNLPPTLAKSQVSSVRKSLKMHLLNLLKMGSSGNYHDLITTLLTDLGATQQEVMKNLPKSEEIKRRSKLQEGAPIAKKLKMEKKMKEVEPVADKKLSENTAIDITAEKFLPVLFPKNIVDVVIQNMSKLPSKMPPHFQASYTPIAAAGTQGQRKHLARLIATQLTAAGLGPGVEEMAKISEEKAKAAALSAREFEEKNAQTIQTIVGRSVSAPKEEKDRSEILLPSGLNVSQSKRIAMRQLDLKQITKPLSPEGMKSMTNSAIYRILKAENTAALEGISKIRVKILSTLLTHYDDVVTDLFLSFIQEDLKNRLDLAFSWLYEEYATYHGFTLSSFSQKDRSLDQYDRCFLSLINGLLYKVNPKDQELVFSRLILESPCITESAMKLIKDFCENEDRVTIGLKTMKELVLRRPTKQKDFLNIILSLTTYDNLDVRNKAIELVEQLHFNAELKSPIEDHALIFLKYLLESKPPVEHLNPSNQALKLSQDLQWNDDLSRLFMQLFLALLPGNHKLIHELASVYVSAIADIKRTILRILENPVKGMGMDSPELLLLVENCPKGAETLVTRIIHILTDKAPPSIALVARVRDLYHKRVPDVRFLIPVLNGLTKKEVIAALPKLLKLNPVVVKEVFNRLLCNHGDSSSSWSSPLTPAELLIALHNIDISKCDMKTVIKSTSLCFAEKSVYTQEVLAVVMQQLMEQSPLPTLFMRTVIQSLSLYPRLIGFVMNILQRLIIKQVWKQKKVWEGFIKCCQRTQPQSFQVLLQLPVEQMENVFETTPELRAPLLEHVESLTDLQKAHVPVPIMELLKQTNMPIENQLNDEVASETKSDEPSQSLSVPQEEKPLGNTDANNYNDPPPPGTEN